MSKLVRAVAAVCLLANAPVHAQEPTHPVAPDSLAAPVDTTLAAHPDTTAVHPDTSAVHATRAPAPEADALSQVVGLEAKRRTAMVAGDTNELATIIAEDATYVHSTGIMQKRDELFRLLLNKSIRYLKFDIEKASYRVYGNTVVGTGVQKIEVMAGGQSRVIHSRYTVVYTMTDGAEKLIAYQSTPLPEMTPAKK